MPVRFMSRFRLISGAVYVLFTLMDIFAQEGVNYRAYRDIYQHAENSEKIPAYCDGHHHPQYGEPNARADNTRIDKVAFELLEDAEINHVPNALDRVGC